MNKFLLLSAAMAAGGTAMGQDFGQVVSSTPILQQVAVPRQVCSVQQVQVQPRKSGAGAVIGAIAGGALGNAVGDGGGRAAATLIGLVGGALLGNSIEGGQRGRTDNVQRCETQTFYETQPVAYNVVYEYAGRQYTVQTPTDPGRTIAVQVSPVITAAQTLADPRYASTQQPVLAAAPPTGYGRRDHSRYAQPAVGQRGTWFRDADRDRADRQMRWESETDRL